METNQASTKDSLSFRDSKDTSPYRDDSLDKRQLFVKARNMVTLQGKNENDVRQMVADEGGSPELAERLLKNLREESKSESRGEGKRDLVIGLIVLAVGLVVTIGSYAAASEGGGSYFITYGLIAAGAIQTIRGLTKL